MTVIAAFAALAAAVVQFDMAEPVWPASAADEVNSSVAFVSGFDWDGAQSLVFGII